MVTAGCGTGMVILASNPWHEKRKCYFNLVIPVSCALKRIIGTAVHLTRFFLILMDWPHNQF